MDCVGVREGYFYRRGVVVGYGMHVGVARRMCKMRLDLGFRGLVDK